MACLFLAIVAVILLPLRIAFVSDKHVVVQKNLPIQILLDVSLSMSATDIVPSRFDAAKASLISLVHQLDGYYLSLIAFSGKPFLFIPFSSSSSAIIDKLSAMNLGDFPPVQDFLGTAIGDALLLGVDNLQHFSDRPSYKPGMAILITDGDSNIGFDPIQVISYYQRLGVPLFVLGVGQEDYLLGKDTRNDPVTTSIHLSLLQQIAEKTGGKFSRVLKKDSFDQSFTQFVETVASHQQQKIQNSFWSLDTYLLYFLVADLLILLIFRICFFVSSYRHQA